MCLVRLLSSIDKNDIAFIDSDLISITIAFGLHAIQRVHTRAIASDYDALVLPGFNFYIFYHKSLADRNNDGVSFLAP